MINTINLVWQDLNQASNVPTNVMTWLNDDQSLTAKLKQKFSDFSVNVLFQQQASPHTHEVEIMGSNKQCVIREVELLGDSQVVVFARSVIPLTNDTKEILSIGPKPLGEVLFNTSIKRGPLQITHTDAIWGRRSIFTIGNTKLLVSEFFMENLYA
ncbi:Chorismate--pyruvate lyase [uncultured Candidatus Thioglobus sp.]|nr:Chorismate--pyruvate lyase [uncultured Candidatus Thioglobus sp.]